MSVPAENLDSFEQEEAHKTLVDLVEKEMSQQGYTFGQPIGEGHTRVAYLATYQSGKFRQSRVVKIPKVKVLENTDSICTRVNLSKGDLDEREAEQAGELEHPNVIDLLDSYEIAGHTINVEEYFNAQNLEEFIKSWGPIKDENKFREIFAQVIAGSKYLINDKNMLHRDIKPSNILIRVKDVLVKLDDLQNARKRENIEERLFPTRGGTAYTHPTLLNSLVTEEPARASELTEIYSIAATMYYALTGEVPFSYKISEVEEDGTDIEINGNSTRVQLFIDGQKSDSITPETHERNLKKALKKVPKKYQKILQRGLTMGAKHYEHFHPLFGLKEDLENTKESNLSKFAKSALKFVKPVILTGLISGGIGLGVHQGKIDAAKETIPTIAQVMAKTEYRDFCLEGLTSFEKAYMLADIHYVNKNLEKDVRKISQKQENPDVVDNHLPMQAFFNGMDLRLSSALLRSSILYQEDLDKTFKNEKRHGNLQVPENFAYSWAASGHLGIDRRPISSWSEGEFAAASYQYLKLCLGPEKNAADVFADYYCTDAEIVNAKVMSGGAHYFPRIVDINNGVGTLNEGYRAFLPSGKVEAIDRAIAFYNITNENGEMNLSKMPEAYKDYNPELATRTIIPRVHW